jgi:hypothetical protein
VAGSRSARRTPSGRGSLWDASGAPLGSLWGSPKAPLGAPPDAGFRDGGEVDDALTALRAELDARAAREGITLETGKELLLRLRARSVERELKTAPLERAKELQDTLLRIREAVGGLA